MRPHRPQSTANNIPLFGIMATRDTQKPSFIRRWGPCIALLAASWAAEAETQYQYDNLGRLVQATEWDGSSNQYAYDANGNVTSLVRTHATTLGGTLVTNGTQTAISMASGQNSQLTFSATAGQSLTVSLGSMSTIPANTLVYVYVFNAIGVLIASASGTTGATLNLPNLAADTYTVTTVSSAAATTGQISATGMAESISSNEGDAPTLPQWAAILLGLLLFAQISRAGSIRSSASRR